MIQSRRAQLKIFISAIAILLLILLLTYAQNTSPESLPEEVLAENETTLVSEPQSSLQPELPVVDNQSTKEIQISLDEKNPIKKELPEIVNKERHKLNDETASQLSSLSGEDERKFIIKHKATYDKEKLNKFEKKKEISEFNIVRIDGKVKDIGDILEDEDIEYLELDQEINPLEDSIGYNIEKVKATDAWDLSKGRGVKVAILDTGIADHSDLGIAGGTSVVSESYGDTHGHGTQVAGVVAATLNEEGIVGVAPETSLFAVKIMEGSSGSLSDAIAGIEWVIDNDMDIISMSFGFESYSQIFKDVLEDAYENEGILLIAASGNEGTDEILYPAAYDSVIAVGSTDENDALAASSSYGFDQELVAPGVNIESTFLNEDYSIASGTSMAAPHVAGVAALIKSYNTSLTNEQIRAKLRNDALDLGDSGKDDYFGYGLVQVDLDSDDFTFVNDSYFYEVFNITDFRTENEAYWFWLSGNGSIDDVDFEEGIYLANITYQSGDKMSRIYNVSENGTVSALALTLEFLDNLTQEGTNSDKIVWVNGNISSRVTGSSPSSIEGICYEDGSFSIDYDWCFFTSSALRDECDDNPSNDIDCGGHTQCFTNAKYTAGSGSSYHTYLPTTSKATSFVISEYWINCDPASEEGPSGSPATYYVVDMKRARCLNSSDFVIEGRYGTNDWVQMGNGDNCGSEVCVFNGTNSTNPNEILNPCLQENVCTGQIQIITEDADGNPVANINVTRTGGSTKLTDSFGVATFDLTQTCQSPQTFTAYCPGGTICDTLTTSVDYIGDYKGREFDCSICTSIVDFELNEEDVIANKEGDSVMVNITLTNIPITSNVEVAFKTQGSNGLISNQVSENFNTTSGQRFKYISKTVPIADNDDFVHVYVDFTNKVNELDEKNNYVLVPLFEKTLTAYLDINTGYPKVDNEIKEYLRLFVNESTSQNGADVTLCIGKKCSQFSSLNDYTLNNANKRQKFGYKDNKIIFSGKDVGKGKPYNAIVGGFLNKDDSKKYIIAYGNDVDGDLAAIKKLVSGKDLFLNINFLNEERTRVIDDLDREGIAVADLLRIPSNKPYYSNRTSDRFAFVVERILNDNNYEVAIRTVKTLNTTSYNNFSILRLKNVNSDFSEDYQEAITNSTKPVVMSGGIFSNLFTWEDDDFGLAKDLASDGHDVWEIEMNGGNNTECDSCPDYTYQDQVDYFWPALIAGVMNYSGKNQVNYIGHSNGCRVALSSLNAYSKGKNGSGFAFNSETGFYDTNLSLPNRPVDKFFGVACPATLNDETRFTEAAREPRFIGGQARGDFAIEQLNESQNFHVTSRDYARLTNPIKGLFVFDTSEISLNLMDFYNDLGIAENSQFNISNVNVSELYLINGYRDYLDSGRPNGQHDGIVHVNDIGVISGTSGVVPIVFYIDSSHTDIKENEAVKNHIRGKLQ